MTGAITAEAAVPIIMGIAIGASVPVLLGAIGAGPTGRRTSLVYLFINVLGTAICLIPYFIANALLPESVRHGAVGPVELALINSGFRVLSTVALLPFINGLRCLAHRLVKDRPEDLVQQAMIDKLEERLVCGTAEREGLHEAMNLPQAYLNRMRGQLGADFDAYLAASWEDLPPGAAHRSSTAIRGVSSKRLTGIWALSSWT